MKSRMRWVIVTFVFLTFSGCSGTSQPALTPASSEAEFGQYASPAMRREVQTETVLHTFAWAGGAMEALPPNPGSVKT
jgi:hypothetical protein